MSSSTNKTQLSIANLGKTFLYKKTSLEVIANISLNVQNHEFVTVIGPSGSGKSTLFNILSGVDEPTTGEIMLNQKIVLDRRGKFGYMPQDAALLPWKTVLENVMLGLVVLGETEKQSREKAFSLLRKFGLADFADHFPNTLSGGMQQRVALLRTVLFHPSFLLLDEPFGSLDALTRHEAQMWLLTVWEKMKSSVLFITHDIQEAILLSDRIYVISARPANVIHEVKVNLPRPRKLTDLTANHAVQLEKKLLSLLMRA